MIRPRNPKTDDAALYRLVLQRLVPIARKARPAIDVRRRTIMKRLCANKVLVLAQDRARKPYGFISFQVRDDLMMIDMLAVHAKQQNKGFGSKLMEAAESYARREGVRVMRLAVDEPNEHAQHFYVRKGYYVAWYLPDQHLYVMEKAL